MKKLCLIITILFLTGNVLSADTGTKTKYWIYFKDKGENFVETNSLSKGGSLYTAAEKSLSARSLERRKRASVNNQIDYTDVPVSINYVNKLKEFGIEIENTSKWFNAVTAFLDESALQKIKELTFVSELKPVVIFKGKKEDADLQVVNNNTLNKITSKYNYGLSLLQNNTINVPKVHDLGINGQGVLVGMLDTGFDWKRHTSLSKRKVLREYDFVFKDSVTANETKDVGGQDSHGTLCFSILGGFAADTLIGPSFNSEFILGKTEDIRSETRIEEDNWVACIEWMESLGIDVASSSLGYNEFDNNIGNYVYSNMDGATATITLAADIAVSKGVVVVIAAGNEGSSTWKYITAPADGKYVIAVGAVSSNGTKASFSSFGPTYDGRIKPDVSALGVSVYHAVSGTKTSYSWSNGTSVACPLVAGVAAMIKSARPDMTPAQVLNALRSTASLAAAPNNELGWGIIDAYKAITYNGIVYGNSPTVEAVTNGIKISTYIASKYTINKSSVKIYYLTPNKSYVAVNMTQESNLDETNSGLYSAVIPVISGSTSFNYYISAIDDKGERRHPYDAPSKSFSVLDKKESATLPTAFSLYQNYPNPFNPSTEIKFDIKQKTNVKLSVFNSLGQLVTVLLDENKNPESYSVSWNGLDSYGKKCSSGMYYYRLETKEFSETKKMMLVK